MDNNYKQKVKDFFRKEGFYVILFLCLCLITTVTVVSIKQEKKNNINTEASNDEQKDKITLNVNEDKNVNNQIPNAEQVEDSTSKNDEKEESNNSQAVVSNSTLTFIKPVDGTLSRGYTYPTPVVISENSQRTIRGIDVNAPVGTEVKAAAEGTVESATYNGVEDGMTIVISHSNGIKTKYSNLSKEIYVKQGDTVTSDTVLGTVGTTAELYSVEKFGEHLNIQVLNQNNEQINPLQYFNY